MKFLQISSKSDKIILLIIIYFNLFLLYSPFSSNIVSFITQSTPNLLIYSNPLTKNLKIVNNPSLGFLGKTKKLLKIIILAGGFDDDYASVETSIYEKLNDIDRCGY